MGKMLGREEELIELLNHADLNGLEDVLCGDALVTEIYNLKSFLSSHLSSHFYRQ